MRRFIGCARRTALVGGLLLMSSCYAIAPAGAAAPGPTINIGDADVVEGDIGSNDLVFEVTLSSATGKLVTVEYDTGGGDAMPGADYQSTSGTVTFNRRETVKTVRVPVLGDDVDEADETLSVTLRRAGGAVIGDGSGTGLIRDDDDAPPPPPTSTLTVSRAGEGAGTVTSSPEGIDCGSTCAAEFDDGESVTLTAVPAGGSTFAGWSGACSGSASTCTVTMAGDQAATATFGVTAPATAMLNVVLDGTTTCDTSNICSVPSGAVSSDPEGIDCDGNTGTCAAAFAVGSIVTLTATPGPTYACANVGDPEPVCIPTSETSTFDGWGGPCASAGTTPTCTLTITPDEQTVTATFGP